MDRVAVAILVLILFDIIAGVVAAARSHTLDSSVMRDGMYNKVGEIMLMMLAMICNYLLGMEPFVAIGIPKEVTYLIAAYIGGMEILSIIENICKINPSLPLAKILSIFNLDSDDDIDVDSAQAPER